MIKRLTDRFLDNDLCGGGGFADPGFVLGQDTEFIFHPLGQVLDLEGRVDHGDVMTSWDPLGGSSGFVLNDVVNDGTSAIFFRGSPGEGGGILCYLCNVGFSWRVRDIYKTPNVPV